MQSSNVKTRKEIKINFNLFFICIFIAIAGTSILGAQIFGLSLNKLALIPLELYLLFRVFNAGKAEIPKPMIAILVFYLAQILGSIFGLFNSAYDVQYPNYSTILINNIIQDITIYIPLALLVSSLNGEDKRKFVSYVKTSLVWVCRIHCVMALLQFVLWNVFSFDLNGLIFVDILKGCLGENFQAVFVYLNNSVRLRVTGLNYEPAVLALLMTVGCCFDKSKIFKLLYWATCFFAFSRSGIITIVIILIGQAIIYLKNNGWKISRKLFYRSLLVLFLLLLAFGVVYLTVDFVREQVDTVLLRIFNLTGNNDGTDRHILYPLCAFYSWLFDLNIIEQLFGVGARVGGLVFVNSPYVSSVMDFNEVMLTSAWEIECDVAAILLGDGEIGFAAYLTILYLFVRHRKTEYALLGIGLFVFGFMYDCFTFTLVQVLVISGLCVSAKDEKKPTLLEGT